MRHALFTALFITLSCSMSAARAEMSHEQLRAALAAAGLRFCTPDEAREDGFYDVRMYLAREAGVARSKRCAWIAKELYVAGGDDCAVVMANVRKKFATCAPALEAMGLPIPDEKTARD